MFGPTSKAGDTKQARQDRPIRILSLPSRVEDLGQGWERLAVDLARLTPLGKLSWGRGVLWLGTPDPSSRCGIRPGAARLVSLYQAHVPTWVAQVEGWSRDLGGSWPPGLPSTEQVRSVRLLAHAALSQAQPVHSDAETEVDRAIMLDDKGQTVSSERQATRGQPPARFVNVPLPKSADGWLAAGGRVHLHQDGDKVHVQNGAGMVVTGSTDRFVLDWRLDVPVQPGARLLVSVLDGAEQVTTIQLRLCGPDEKCSEQLVAPNLAVPLAHSSGRVSRAELTFQMARVPFQVTLGDLALVVPELMDRTQALTAPFPWQGRQWLDMGVITPSVIALDEQHGRGLSYWPAQVTTGTVESQLPIPVREVERLTLRWQLPPTWLGADGCILDAEFVFERGQEARYLCLSRAATRQDFSAADLGLSETGRLGRLERILWHLRKPEGEDGVLSLQVAVLGQDLFSVWDRLGHRPLLRLDGKRVYADPGAWAAALPTAAKSGVFWLGLPVAFAGDFLREELPPLVASALPWLTLQRIAMEPREPIDWLSWLKLLAPEVPVRPSVWLKLVKLASGTALFLLLWRLGWGPILWRGLRAQARLWLWKVPRGLLAFGWRAGTRLAPWLNLGVGLVAVPALLIWAGGSGDGWQGRFLFGASLILGVQVYRYWQQYGPWRAPDERIFWPRFGGLSLGFAVLTLVWALAYRRHDAEAIWALALLPAAIYGLLPGVVAALGKLFGGFFYTAWGGVWLMATGGLYAAGLSMPATGGSENYYFTFGGMAAVATCWYLLVGLRGWLERRWPVTAGYVHGGAGSLFFTIALVLLAMTAVLLFAGLEPVAEQFAVMVYYALVAGTAREIVALRRERQKETPEGGAG